MFTETEYAALLMRLAELGEEKFRAFNEKLMPGTTGTYGVRIPLLRTMATMQKASSPWRGTIHTKNACCRGL